MTELIPSRDLSADAPADQTAAAAELLAPLVSAAAATPCEVIC